LFFTTISKIRKEIVTVENTVLDLKVHLLHLCKCRSQTFLSKTFENSLNMQKQKKIVWEKGECILFVEYRPHFDLFFTTIFMSKKMFFFKSARTLKKALHNTKMDCRHTIALDKCAM